MNLYADISGRTLPVTKTGKPDLYQVRHVNISKYMLFSEAEVFGIKLHLLNIYQLKQFSLKNCIFYNILICPGPFFIQQN